MPVETATPVGSASVIDHAAESMEKVVDSSAAATTGAVESVADVAEGAVQTALSVRVTVLEKRLEDVFSAAFCEGIVDCFLTRAAQSFAPHALGASVEAFGKELAALQQCHVLVAGRVLTLHAMARKAGFAVT